MRTYSLSHVGDSELTRGLSALVAQDRVTTARLLAHIAEFDARRLYLPAAYPSMHAYCVHELHLSEDAAYKRIRAARAARSFPEIFEALADGRLNLTVVRLLAPHLTEANATELLNAAANRTKLEVEELIAMRFPRSETFDLVQALPGSPLPPDTQLAPGRVGPGNPGDQLVGEAQLAARQVEAPEFPRIGATDQLAARPVSQCSKIAPVSQDRFLVQLTIERSTHQKLLRALNLLAHSLPSGDLAQVLDRALDALIEKLERRKFAATARPRPDRVPSEPAHANRRPGHAARHIPARVKRAVWERDGEQCTFVSESGHRCPARKFLEFDHVEPVARGGRSTVAGIRLRCRAHNQYGAELAFGAQFMRRKRELAQQAALIRREASRSSRTAAQEVIAPLRQLGFSADEARRAAALCETIPEASLERRLRRALQYFQPRRRVPAACDGSEAIAASV